MFSTSPISPATDCFSLSLSKILDDTFRSKTKELDEREKKMSKMVKFN